MYLPNVHNTHLLIQYFAIICYYLSKSHVYKIKSRYSLLQTYYIGLLGRYIKTSCLNIYQSFNKLSSWFQKKKKTNKNVTLCLFGELTMNFYYIYGYLPYTLTNDIIFCVYQFCGTSTNIFIVPTYTTSVVLDTCTIVCHVHVTTFLMAKKTNVCFSKYFKNFGSSLHKF